MLLYQSKYNSLFKITKGKPKAIKISVLEFRSFGIRLKPRYIVGAELLDQ